MEKVMDFEELKRVRTLIHSEQAEKSNYLLRKQIVHTWWIKKITWKGEIPPSLFSRSISNLMYLFHIPKGVQPTRGRESLSAADGTMKNMLCDLAASASRFCKLLCVDYTTTTWIINHCFTQSAAQWSTTILGSCLERNKRCWIEVSSKRHRTGTTYWRTQIKLTTIDSGMAGKKPHKFNQRLIQKKRT